jgi:hypothetical protein
MNTTYIRCIPPSSRKRKGEKTAGVIFRNADAIEKIGVDFYSEVLKSRLQGGLSRHGSRIMKNDLTFA